MNEQIIRPESRRRVRRSIMSFFGLSAPGAVGSIAVEARDPNAFSFSQSVMNVYDWIMSGGMLITEKLDAHGYHRSAQVGRVALSASHIVVAGAGTVTAYERLESHEAASSTSLFSSLAIAGLSAAAIAYEHNRDKKEDAPTEDSDRYHELSRRMAKRLFWTKASEAGFTTAGVGAQLATTAEQPTTGIAIIAAVGITAGVAAPMIAQMKDEWDHRRDMGNSRADEQLTNLRTISD